MPNHETDQTPEEKFKRDLHAEWEWGEAEMEALMNILREAGAWKKKNAQP